MKESIRVRFAPSPTGPLHIGGVRTALFNYLFAKQNNGKFVLRIEDTDNTRRVIGAEKYIKDALSWCGITFDEDPWQGGGYGPYRQSERKNLYKKYILDLIEKGAAYYAFDSPVELDSIRKKNEQEGKTFVYNWESRTSGSLNNSLILNDKSTAIKLASGVPYVVRFKCPKDIDVKVNDLIRGDIIVNSGLLDDKILLKSDGTPTYHFANIVDDHSMKISHVIRGEEWLPSLPLHKLLYDAFEWNCPKFAHLPLILNPAGKGKLSKRDGNKHGFPVYPIAWNKEAGFKESGYVNEALINFLVFLGWSPDSEKEIYGLKDLVSVFDINKVNKSGARFDADKIKWFNHHYIQEKENSFLAQEVVKLNRNLKKFDPKHVSSVIGLVKNRANLINDLWPLMEYFFERPKDYSAKAVEKHWRIGSKNFLRTLANDLSAFSFCDEKHLSEDLSRWMAKKGCSHGELMPALRLALVGELKGVGITDILKIIGKEESIYRIKRLLTSVR